jgi:hypothetical protein
MSLPLIPLVSGTDAKAEDVQNNFNELLDLNVFHEIPVGLINGTNKDFLTAFKFKIGTLRVYLFSPPTPGVVRLLKGTEYSETLDITSSYGTGFHMITAPSGSQVVVVDYQKDNHA